MKEHSKYMQEIKILSKKLQEKYNLTNKGAESLIINTIILNPNNAHSFENSIYKELKPKEKELLNFIRRNIPKNLEAKIFENKSLLPIPQIKQENSLDYSIIPKNEENKINEIAENILKENYILTKSKKPDYSQQWDAAKRLAYASLVLNNFDKTKAENDIKNFLKSFKIPKST